MIDAQIQRNYLRSVTLDFMVAAALRDDVVETKEDTLSWIQTLDVPGGNIIIDRDYMNSV